MVIGVCEIPRQYHLMDVLVSGYDDVNFEPH